MQSPITILQISYYTDPDHIVEYLFCNFQVVVVVVFFFEYNKSWTSVNSILLRYNGVGIFNCRSFGITEL